MIRVQAFQVWPFPAVDKWHGSRIEQFRAVISLDDGGRLRQLKPRSDADRAVIEHLRVVTFRVGNYNVVGGAAELPLIELARLRLDIATHTGMVAELYVSDPSAGKAAEAGEAWMLAIFDGARTREQRDADRVKRAEARRRGTCRTCRRPL
ncbi:MAG TPA: hypothetical protein VGY54_03975 [Polyangiaceae bacterium]|jgi:hypothetical protein|nr:hypothetical protein [Polyangiaceae bacterium]